VHDLSLYLLELLENSIGAGAGHVDVSLLIDRAGDQLRLTVDDDGSGLSAPAEQILDPFFTTKPGKNTGLGLSLLKADAQAAGGDLVIAPSPSLGGARVETHMSYAHVDRVPLGDMAATLTVISATNPDVRFTVTLTGDQFDPPLLRASPAAAADRLAAELAAHRLEATTDKES
jgi:signal transduction histidine kinase